MKDTPEVREALLELSNLLATIAQTKLDAASGSNTVESLVLVTQSSGFAESAVLLRTFHDAMASTVNPVNPVEKKKSARVYVH